MKPKPVIRIFHNMARSGGTTVCKCIGAMNGVRLLSEIHPQANHVKYLNVVDQAHRWYGLVSPQQVASKPAFLDGLNSVHSACKNLGLHLVLRDWASIDFIGKLLVAEPVNRFTLNQAVEGHFDIREIALVRHPLDLWLSTQRLKVYNGKLDVKQFLAGYCRYAKLVAHNFVRYEDFALEPEFVLQRVCAKLELDFDPGFANRWYHNENITGDNKKSSRGSSGKEGQTIRPMVRRSVAQVLIDQLSENKNYVKINDLLGYRNDLPETA